MLKSKNRFKLREKFMSHRSKVMIKPVLLLFMSFFVFVIGCKKGSTSDPDPASISFGYGSLKVNGVFSGFDYIGLNTCFFKNLTNKSLCY